MKTLTPKEICAMALKEGYVKTSTQFWSAVRLLGVSPEEHLRRMCVARAEKARDWDNFQNPGWRRDEE